MRVVALHGFAGAPANFDEVRAACGDDVEWITPALLGHGAAAPDVRRYDDEVDRLAAEIPAGPRPVLLGYSFGGRLAMGLVARHPQRWRAAVFVGANPGLGDAHARDERRRADRKWTTLLADGDLDRFLDAWERQPIFASQMQLDPARRERQRAQRGHLDPRGLSRAMELLGLGEMPCWIDGLAASGVPMTLVVGALDAKHVAIARDVEAKVASAAVEIVPDVGHNVVLEAPSTIVEALRRVQERSHGD